MGKSMVSFDFPGKIIGTMIKKWQNPWFPSIFPNNPCFILAFPPVSGILRDRGRLSTLRRTAHGAFGTPVTDRTRQFGRFDGGPNQQKYWESPKS
jgi:hypothetical protein